MVVIVPVRMVDEPENSPVVRRTRETRLRRPDKLIRVPTGAVLEDEAMAKVGKAARRRLVSLTIRADLIEAAQALGVDASQAAEAGIAEAIRRAREAAWLEANRDAFAEHTAWLDEHGTPLEPAMDNVEGWFAAIDRCAAAGPFMADGREQPASPDRIIGPD